MSSRFDVPSALKALRGMICAVGATRWMIPATMVPCPKACGTCPVQDARGGLVEDGRRGLIQDDDCPLDQDGRRRLVQDGGSGLAQIGEFGRYAGQAASEVKTRDQRGAEDGVVGVHARINDSHNPRTRSEE